MTTAPDGFPLIREELRSWKAPPRFWWRDDDTRDDSASFRRMLEWSTRLELPGMISVIAGRTPAAVPEALAVHPHLRAAQHGWMHRNHEPTGRLKSEFGESRSREDALDDMANGLRRMQELFGAENFFPVFVPPFNTIAAKHVSLVAELGFRGLSTAGKPLHGPLEDYRTPADEPRRQKPPGIPIVDVHVEILRYGRGTPTPMPPALLQRFVVRVLKHLRSRGKQQIPVGILTHHADMYNDRAWAVLAALVEAMRREGCEWLAPPALFPPLPSGPSLFGLRVPGTSGAIGSLRGWLAGRR